MSVAKFIVDIAPLTRLPLARSQSFSYVSERKLPIGTLVSIPLFSRKVEGIVLKNREDFHRFGNIKLKKIDKILEENFLDEKQLGLAHFISEYYLCPLGIILKALVPRRVKQRNPQQGKKFGPGCANIILTREQTAAIQAITKNYRQNNKCFLLFGPAASGKTEVYIHAILKLKKQAEDLQFLILLPELTLTPQALERYGRYFKPEEIVVLHSKISKGQFFAGWQKINAGKAKIIIGSRMAVFAPFRKLGLVVVDEEQDMSYKQWDMNPRYDARTVARKLAAMHRCPLIFGSATPRVEDYGKARQGEYELLKLPPLKLPGRQARILQSKIELIDLKKEKWQKNASPLSRKLQAEISYALKNKLQTILFIHRQGMSNFSVCSSCKSVLRCPKCDRAVIYDQSGIYRCVHCAYRSSVIPACAKCGGLVFENVGLGTQKIEREVAKIFPEARLARADNQTMRAPRAQEKLYADFTAGKIDILIGTQMISKGWNLPSMALVGIIDGDALLSIPDFTAAEKAYQTILQVAGRVSRPGAEFPGLVLVQTFNPESIFFRAIAENDPEKFLQKELAERKLLSLPPYGRLIRLVFQDYSDKKAILESQRIYASLLKKKINGLKITESEKPLIDNIRGRHRRQIILKVVSPSLPSALTETIKSLPAGWIIDIDPISLV